MQSKIGVYGLGAMGSNIALNIANKGFPVSVYNQMIEGNSRIVEDFLSKNNSANIRGFSDIQEFISSLEQPRKVLIMVTAGLAVDEVVQQIVSYMDSNDIVIDGGNSNYLDTQSRAKKYNVRYLGCGISGGWYGALHGPSMMVGGEYGAWTEVRDILQEISSKRDSGSACCQWFGGAGAGHFVKMVHNGIEYAMMQSIAEAYDVLRNVLRLSNLEISAIFKKWNNQELDSYLMKISSDVLLIKDKSSYLIDNVIDRSGQKGTGIDFATCALKYGVSASTIIAAIDARFVSFSEHRLRTKSKYEFLNYEQNSGLILNGLRDGIYCAYLIAFFQGMSLIQRVSDEQSWDIGLDEVSLVWEEGCILKSNLFKNLSEYLTPRLSAQVFLQEDIESRIRGLSQIISLLLPSGIPMPVLSASLNFYNSIRSEKLPASLIQLQRECFGSHGFEKIDSPEELSYFSMD